MKHSFKNKLFILIALLALFVGMLGVAPVLAATTFVDESPALPDGMSSGTLYNVWGSSAGDVYAVGGGYIGNDGIPLLYHNAGSGWTPENLTLPDGLTAGGMFGVWGSGADNIYAVGWGRDLNGSQGPLVYHNDGNSWTGTSLALPHEWTWGGLYKVWGSSANDIYVVGFSNGPLAYHNDGNSWWPISPANSGWFYDVWGSGANDVYVVGQGNDSLPRVYHNDGNGWTEASLPLPAGWTQGYLFRIWGSSANDVYAVGSGYDSNGNGLPLLYHNDGSGWTEATPALPDGWTYGSLRGIWGSNASDVYMVGYGAMGKSNDLPLLFHNDGNGWTEVALTVPDGWGSTYLQGVWGSSTGDVYFVGDGYPDSSATPLIYHTGASQTTAPTVSTDSIETLNARQVNATISDLGNPASVSAYGVVYNTTGNPDTDDSKVERNAVISVDDLPYAFNIGMDEMGLTAGAKYYVRAFATNATGTSYGTELVVYGTPGAFTINSPLDGATDISTSPTISWNPSTGATDYQYCVAADITDCTSDLTGSNWHLTSGATSVNLSGLLSDTNYAWGVRAVVGTPPSYKWVTGAPFDFTTAADSSHTVTFNANGGTGSMSDQSASSATALTTNTFSRSGFTFTGWNTAADGSGTSYANQQHYDFSADLDLYAQWIPAIDPMAPLTSDFTYLTGGWQVENHPRIMGDVNGDGKDDLIGFGNTAVWVGLANSSGDGFGPMTQWTSDMTYLTEGWLVANHPRMVGDVNNDGRDDLIGFGNTAVWVALSNGTSFAPMTQWTSDMTYLTGGWQVANHPRMVGDVDNDGNDDLIGFGNTAVWVALSNGTNGFAPMTQWTTDMTYLTGGWQVANHPRMVGDVNNDGNDDLIGFGNTAVWVALSNGTNGFAPMTQWTSDFTYLTGGWDVKYHPRTVGDVNNDGRVDLIGFGNTAVWAALSNGSGFAPMIQWTSDFTYMTGGWDVKYHPRTQGDVNGDGKIDLVGFGNTAVWVAITK